MDPYVRVLNLMKKKGAETNTSWVNTGTVTSPPPNLIVEFNNMPLYKDDLFIADFLLQGYTREATITDGSGTAINFADSSLKAGDTVAIMPLVDGQTYLLLCKVVSI